MSDESNPRPRPPREDGGGRDLSASSGLGEIGDVTHSMRLVRRFQGGDDAALNELFGRYYERVERMARIRMGPRLRRLTESDDIVQNTFAIAFKKIGQIELRDHSSIIQYLSKLLENQIKGAVDYFGAQKRDSTREVPLETRSEGGEARVEPVDRAPQPIDHAVASELKDLYDSCVQALAPDHREVILLREYADASWPEITAALGRPTEHAAQELYCRAQIKLANCLRRRCGGASTS